MKAQFLGPIDRVTGSCTWLIDEETELEFLVDCGMLQGEPDDTGWNQGRFPFKPAALNFVLLTHAHIDHCGLLPLLYKKGFRGSVYATRETAELARLTMGDAARQKGCAYTERDVESVKFHEPAGDGAMNKPSPVGHDLFIAFYRSAHIVGAVSIQVLWGPREKQRKITFSGDLGPNDEDQEVLPLLRHRERPWPGDYAVIESTYGGRVRAPEEKDNEARRERLREVVERSVRDEGTLVIPSFAVDRTQAVLLDLTEIFRRDALGPRRLVGVSFYLHARQASRVNAVYAEAMRRKVLSANKKLRPYWLGKGIFRALGLDPSVPEHERAVERYMREILLDEASETRPGSEPLIPGPHRFHQVWTRGQLAPVSPGPAVLLTGGGMCEGGPVVAYLDALLRSPRTTIAFTGYLSGGTLGAQLARLEEMAEADRSRLSETIDIPLREETKQIALSEVNTRFVSLRGYSGHVDQSSLVSWVFGEFRGQPSIAGRTVFIQHGQAQARAALRQALLGRAAEVIPGADFRVELPDRNRWFDLDAGRWVNDGPQTKQQLRDRVAELERQLQAVQQNR